MRHKVFVALVAVAHAALSIELFVLAFGSGMERFDSSASPSTGERLLEGLVTILHAPLVTLALPQSPAGWFPGLWGYIPFLLNSLLWAAVLVWTARLYQSRRRSLKP